MQNKTEAVSLVPSYMKSYENKKKSIWFEGFLMTCYLWKILLVFIWLTHFLMTSYGFYSYWNRKILPVFYMTSQVIYLLNINKVEMNMFLYLILQICKCQLRLKCLEISRQLVWSCACSTIPYNIQVFIKKSTALSIRSSAPVRPKIDQVITLYDFIWLFSLWLWNHMLS